ncbi:ABC transporter substrate-binding protein [Rhodosalinus halophilus]|uniref:ABC transporter substrate-binding protein n=1 Tax=Rhodosalinus halophilus TaxID=2259333 RepID=A0A365U8E0_9RHOB|nr:ABC transporter substrate-binding protein [Rhodosalinus halophilus]RBI84922.1 ABC transporter substrate-binding protein [Rhodosalinus halophilus]
MKLGKSLLAGVCALAMVPAAQAADVKVGLISTLSGGGAALGVDIRDGFLLGIEHAGVDNVEVVVEDDQRKPEVAVQVADELIQSEEVDILTGIVFSNIALAVVPSAVNQGKFYVSPNAGPSQLAGRGCHPNYFNVSWQNDAMHEAAGAYANDAGYESAFIMAPNYPAGQDGLTGFKRFYEGEVVSEVYTKLGQTDYAAEIAQIRASEADVAYFFLPGGMGISFLKQYADAGVDIPLIGPGFSFDQTILPAVGDAAAGVRNTSEWSPDLDNAANQRFVEGFREAYDRIPSMYAAQAYDAAQLIVSAMGKADVSDADAFRAALREADFDSVRGDFEFAPNQHPIQDVYVREVVQQDGVWTNMIVGPSLQDHSDVYGEDCNM